MGFGEPVHVPVLAVRVWPSTVVPEMVGATVLTGADDDWSMTSVIAPGRKMSSDEPTWTAAVVAPFGRNPSTFMMLESNPSWLT